MSTSPPQESLFLRSLLDASAEAIISTDGAGLITSFNRRAEQLTGYSASEVIGQQSLLFWHVQEQLKTRLKAPKPKRNKDSSLGFRAFAAHAELTSHSQDQIWTITKKDQSQFTAQLILSPMAETGKEVAGYLALYQDVTEHQSTLRTLHQEEQRFEDMVDYSAMGMATVSLEGAWISLNKSFCELLGYSQEELLQTTVQHITHPDDIEDDWGKAQQLVKGELTHYNMEKRYLHKNGSTVWVLLSVSLVRDNDRKPLYFVSQVQDITLRKLATEELAASVDLLREFIAHAPVAIAMLDKDMRYLNVSERWITDYNLPADQVIGRSHYELFPTIPPRWKEVHQRVLRGATESSREDDLTLEDGSVVWLNWEARPWHNSHGGIGGLIFFTRNITKQKKSQQKLERLVSELERSNRELEEFAYVASHDMQEPLRAVAACAEILQSRYQKQLDPRADELITHIVDGANRMQSLIQDLLQLSQINSRSSKPVKVDTNLVCRSVLQDLSGEIKKSLARIELHDLPRVPGDSTQLKQVFQNLLSNALKYRGADRPVITIKATIKEDHSEFTVSDNGIGIESPYFKQIFDIFQRLHTRQEYPGTGIGLALCKKIIERHGGSIWLTSSPGNGSVFYFTLPHSCPNV